MSIKLPLKITVSNYTTCCTKCITECNLCYFAVIQGTKAYLPLGQRYFRVGRGGGHKCMYLLAVPLSIISTMLTSHAAIKFKLELSAVTNNYAAYTIVDTLLFLYAVLGGEPDIFNCRMNNVTKTLIIVNISMLLTGLLEYLDLAKDVRTCPVKKQPMHEVKQQLSNCYDFFIAV